MSDPFDNTFDFDDNDGFGDSDDSFGADDAFAADDLFDDEQNNAWTNDDSPAPADLSHINRGDAQISFGMNCGGTCRSEGGGEFGGDKYEYWYDKD